jgi:hypothetical protein
MLDRYRRGEIHAIDVANAFGVGFKVARPAERMR